MRSTFDLIFAIFASNQDSDFYQALEGRMYIEEAPEDTPAPYAVVVDNGASATPGMGFLSESHDITIAIYDIAQSPNNILSVGEACKRLYHCQRVIDTSGLSLIGSQYTSAQLNRFPDENRWEYLVSFNFLVDNEH